MTRYLVACLHANRELPITHFVDAHDKESAIRAFMYWHGIHHPYRRAYHVTVYEMI